MKFEISPEVSGVVKEFAKDHGSTTDEAAEHILTVGINRLNALRKYAKATAKKPAPKKPAKKAAKAKGPIARKGGGKAKAKKAAEAPAAAEA